MRIRATAAMAAVLLCAASLGSAETTPPGLYHAYGAGPEPCGSWLAERRGGVTFELEERRLTMWTLIIIHILNDQKFQVIGNVLFETSQACEEQRLEAQQAAMESLHVPDKAIQTNCYPVAKMDDDGHIRNLTR